MAISTLATRKRLVAAKLETTQGTAISLAAADGTTPCFDPALKYTIPMNKRPSQGSKSQHPGVPGPRSGELTFKSHVYNSGSATNPTWASTLLAACGMVGAGGVYTPVTGSSSASTITAGLYQAGRLKTIVGAAGNFVLRGTNGNPVEIEWRFLGKWAAPTTTSIITPTYDTIIPPRAAGATVTIGGTAYKIKEWMLDPGNVLTLVGDQNDATGYHLCVADDGNPTLTVKLMATTAKDFYADHIAGTEAAFSCALGSGANNLVTIAAAKTQLQDPPEDEDDSGYMLDSLTFQLNKNAAAGDDEFSVTLA
jgi:hypothetical protein